MALRKCDRCGRSHATVSHYVPSGEGKYKVEWICFDCMEAELDE